MFLKKLLVILFLFSLFSIGFLPAAVAAAGGGSTTDLTGDGLGLASPSPSPSASPSGSPSTSASDSNPDFKCDFVYGAKASGDSGLNALKFYDAKANNASDFKSSVYGGIDFLASDLQDKRELDKKIPLGTIRFLTPMDSPVAPIMPQNEVKNDASYAFAKPVLVEVGPSTQAGLPNGGKPFLALLKKMSFSILPSVSPVKRLYNTDYAPSLPSIGGKTEKIRASDVYFISIDSNKPFDITSTDSKNKRISGITLENKLPYCQFVYVKNEEDGSSVGKWVSAINFGGSTSTYILWHNDKAAAVAAGLNGVSNYAGKVYYHQLSFGITADLSLKPCNSLVFTSSEVNGSAGFTQVKLDAIPVFSAKPDASFDPQANNKVLLTGELSAELKAASGVTVNAVLLPVFYDVSAFNLFACYTRKAGNLCAQTVQAGDGSELPEMIVCPNNPAGKNSFELRENGDYLARITLAAGGKDYVVAEKLLRYSKSNGLMGQFYLTHPKPLPDSKYSPNTNGSKTSASGVVGNLTFSMKDLSQESYDVEATTGTPPVKLTDIVSAPKFGVVKTLSASGVYYAGTRFKAQNKLDGVVLTFFQSKATVGKGNACFASQNNGKLLVDKCSAEAPFCWGAYLGNYRCYPDGARYGYPAADPFGCAGGEWKGDTDGTAFLLVESMKDGKPISGGWCTSETRAKEIAKSLNCTPGSQKKTPFYSDVEAFSTSRYGTVSDHEVSVWDCRGKGQWWAKGLVASPQSSIPKTGKAASSKEQDSSKVPPATRAKGTALCKATYGSSYACRSDSACDQDPNKYVDGDLCPGNLYCCALKPSSAAAAAKAKCASTPIGKCKVSITCEEITTPSGSKACVPKEGVSTQKVPKTQRTLNLVPSDRLCETYSADKCSKQNLCDVAYAGSASYCISKTCEELSVSDCRKVPVCEVTYASGENYCTSKTCSELSLSLCRKYSSCQVAGAGSESYCSSRTCDELSTSRCRQFPECEVVNAGGQSYCTSK